MITKTRRGNSNDEGEGALVPPRLKENHGRATKRGEVEENRRRLGSGKRTGAGGAAAK